MKLDLGSGPIPLDGHVGLDLCGTRGNWAAPEPGSVLYWNFESASPWPLQTGVIDALYSSHCIEHLTGENVEVNERPFAPGLQRSKTVDTDLLVWFMSEAWRVAKEGAEFLVRWPAFFHPETRAPLPLAFADPTHRRIIVPETFHYFSRDGRTDLGVSYAWRCNWRVEQMSWRGLNESHSLVEHIALLVKEPLD